VLRRLLAIRGSNKRLDQIRSVKIFTIHHNNVVIKSRRMRRGYVARMREMTTVFRKPDGNKLFGRSQRRRNGSMKTEFEEIGCECVE
jgi:hypothetical protein